MEKAVQQERARIAQRLGEAETEYELRALIQNQEEQRLHAERARLEQRRKAIEEAELALTLLRGAGTRVESAIALLQDLM